MTPKKIFLFFALFVSQMAWSQTNGLHAGFLFDRFEETLSGGERIEAGGPFYYKEMDEDETLWGIPPLCWELFNSAIDVQKFAFAYPVLTFNRYGKEYRWQFVQLLSWAGGSNQQDNDTKRFTIFPIYFQQRSSDTNLNYTALFPFYGTVKKRLFSDEVSVIMFPIYFRSRKGGVTTENYVFPFVAKKRGDSVTGWKVLPFAGHEHKDPTTRTNGFGEEEKIPGYDRRFTMFPFYLHSLSGIGSDNPVEEKAFLPAYYSIRSPQQDLTTVVWPFITHIENRERKYKEWQTPWPLIVFARGEGQNTSRVFPFFGYATNKTEERVFYMWPIYKVNHTRGETLDRTRTRIALFFYSTLHQVNKETGKFSDRRDMWPFFTYRRDLNGNSRLQIIAPLEPILPFSTSVEREYSPVWSFWRGEKNPTTGAASYSLLWNLYRRETKPDSKKCSLLFGLFQYQSDAVGRQMRIFYVSVLKSRSGTDAARDGGKATDGRDQK
jgi:hypothetical protein